MKNLHTGLYVKSFLKNQNLMGTKEEAKIVKISGIADGQVTLKIGEERPMHAQEANTLIVDWDAAVGNASTWTIDEVTNIEDICHNVTISSVGHSTLYLNYPVAIPYGVTAYTATNIEGEWLKMAELSGTIPAETAVVLKGDEGSYTFNITKETRSNIVCILEGTPYKQTIAKNNDNNDKYYVLANVDITPNDGVDKKELGFYIATNNGNENEFINAANKAYLHSTDPIPVSFFGFRFEGEDDETTLIKDICDENVDKPVLYDLSGRKITEITEKGIYIVNGKKVVY